jgi:hypothetical protein
MLFDPVYEDPVLTWPLLEGKEAEKDMQVWLASISWVHEILREFSDPLEKINGERDGLGAAIV